MLMLLYQCQGNTKAVKDPARQRGVRLRAAIDTDIGDALACLSPELELVAVTTVYGNVRARADPARPARGGPAPPFT